MTYSIIWVEEEEKFHYIKGEFNESDYPNGFVDYHVKVENGIISEDSWDNQNVGRRFVDCYSPQLWEKAS